MEHLLARTKFTSQLVCCKMGRAAWFRSDRKTTLSAAISSRFDGEKSHQMMGNGNPDQILTNFNPKSMCNCLRYTHGFHGFTRYSCILDQIKDSNVFHSIHERLLKLSQVMILCKKQFCYHKLKLGLIKLISHHKQNKTMVSTQIQTTQKINVKPI